MSIYIYINVCGERSVGQDICAMYYMNQYIDTESLTRDLICIYNIHANGNTNKHT